MQHIVVDNKINAYLFEFYENTFTPQGKLNKHKKAFMIKLRNAYVISIANCLFLGAELTLQMRVHTGRKLIIMSKYT